MFFRIPRLTPGYIRYLQTQAAQTVLQNREGPAMPRMAMLLGLMGIGMSGYSSRQLTLHYKAGLGDIQLGRCQAEGPGRPSWTPPEPACGSTRISPSCTPPSDQMNVDE
uniref:Uncharacterized protein n=1 Tax=Stegastes partitus TaxID=144197 RepID=A0A3B5ADR2_9TELE